MNRTQSYECNEPDVIFENFGDDTIILNLQTGNYYSLNPVGMVYWELLSQGVPAADVVAFAASSLSEAPGREILEQDLDDLMADFRGQGLLRESDTVRSAAEVQLQSTPPAKYDKPRISIYSDVAEMILLDPVHDVAETGWPEPAKNADAAAGQNP